ncbi:unnamed protein product [Rhizoctonia solani]|uniref:Fungal-type protein kinase domain-containing protein n=1 Tax=Rhizoctonia solani TaxID=456999 RepID=A0A8H3B773_9AGAM|nr:unnamed protein product [Rhizoctonia solani]
MGTLLPKVFADPSLSLDQMQSYGYGGLTNKAPSSRLESTLSKTSHDSWYFCAVPKGSILPIGGSTPCLIPWLPCATLQMCHLLEVISRARKVDNLANHLPEVFGQLEIDPLGTGRIRDDLGISASSPRPWRVYRIVIFEKLYPIIQLPGDDLIFTWVECIRCHYLAWNAGIRHLDLSLSNLMYRKRGGCIRYGVVNDWDLGDWDPGTLIELKLAGTLRKQPYSLHLNYWN